MRVLITGGTGFLGLRLAEALAARGRLAGAEISEILLTDLAPPPPSVSLPAGTTFRAGDAGDAALVEELCGGKDPLTVYHLASVVSAGGERDFDLALRVNLDGGRLLLEALRRRGDAPRLVFASSVAIFGGEVGRVMSDRTKPTPATTYGMTKAVMELLINDMSRKGFLDGRSARLPTVIVRPGKPNAAASSYASGLFREPLKGEEHVLPVPLSARILVAGYATVVENLIRLAELPGEALGLDRAVSFPCLTVSAGEMLESLQRVAAGRALGKITQAPDPAITAIVEGWPQEAELSRARALGMAEDSGLDEIVRRYIADYVDGQA